MFNPSSAVCPGTTAAAALLAGPHDGPVGVLLEMNGEKWAFVNLKRGQCVPARSPRRHVLSGNRESGARRVAAAAAKREALPLVARVSFDDDATFHAPLSPYAS